MKPVQSTIQSLVEAAKGLALFGALISIFLTPLLGSAVFFYCVSKLTDRPGIFPVGLVVGLMMTVYSASKFKSLMQEYNLKLWK